MSSIIMHIYISKRIQEELNLSNKFLAGSVLPDMIKIKTMDRKGTHYIKEVENSTKRLPDLEKFLDENKSRFNDEIVLGYYAHLIEDKIWFDNYIDSFAKCIDEENILYTSDNTIHSPEQFRKDIYADYVSVDNYLITQSNMDIDSVRSNIKKELVGYDVDNVVEENIQFPTLPDDARIIFISQSCLEDYINESVNVVKDELKRIIGE